MDRFNVIGLMSGTSLDGLDIAHCTFELKEGRWSFDIVHCETVSYTSSWRSKLVNSADLDELELNMLDELYGKYLGEEVARFSKKHKVHPDFISSHGHTVIHQPEKRRTVQIGNGKTMSDASGFPVVNDFRTENVRAGGQGAPLVPIGDMLLFSGYKACLNLGGIANISEKANGEIKAYDIAICNLAFNYFASQAGLNFDVNGNLGRSGKVDVKLLDELNNLTYFNLTGPKSLDASFFKNQMLPLLSAKKREIADVARTCYEHLVFQIVSSVHNVGPVLITGGGAHNEFIIELLRSTNKIEIALADNNLIDFKEALIFAFLGVLRIRGEVNCLASVTGASGDMCTGQLHGF